MYVCDRRTKEKLFTEFFNLEYHEKAVQTINFDEIQLQLLPHLPSTILKTYKGLDFVCTNTHAPHLDGINTDEKA